MLTFRVSLLLLAASAALCQPSFFYPINIPLGGSIVSLVAGDFNNDGIGDFAVSYQISPQTTGAAIFLGQRDGSLLRKDLIGVYPKWVLVAAVDVNGDGNLDLVTNEVVLLGKGDGTFRPGPQSGLGVTLLTVADFNNDGIPDVLTGFAKTQLGLGDGTFGPTIESPPTFPPFGFGSIAGVATGDFNDDGYIDVFFAGNRGTEIWLGNGDGTFQRTSVSQNTSGKPVAGDVDHDGKADIVVPVGSDIAIILAGGRYGTSASPPLSGGGGFLGPLALADFDGDKNIDLADYFFVFRGNGDGTFLPPVTLGQMFGWDKQVSLVQPPPPLVVSDVNGDGKPDLIGVGPTLDTMTILINSSGTVVASAPAFLAPTGDPVLAPGAIATLYGAGLSVTTATATVPLPTVLGNTSVEIVDDSGKIFQTPLLYVSPTQINFQVPDDAALGFAIINVLGTGRPRGAHSTLIQQVATGIFTLDGSGKGTPAASAVSIAPDGTRTALSVTSPIPISATGQVYLSLYGTGFRHATSGSCSVGGTAVTPTYFGPQSPSAVIDQVNLLIPANTPKGRVDINCRFAFPSDLMPVYGNGNKVTINVQ